MDVFSLFTLFGGLAFFLYGMSVMSSGLEKMAGGRLEQLLRQMTDNPFKSLLLGAGITIAIQSSSALTVMLVGLVNSGIMELSQTVGVIMGSNIGTTLTAWILSLSGIESDNFWLRLLKPESFSPIMAFIGIVLIMVSKRDRRKSAGSIFVGFSILMFGMELMKGAMSPLADMPEFADILTAFTDPLLGLLVGTVFTGVIQSSAATVGILQALSLTGGITFGMALPLVVGANIGTCVTALISSIGVNKNAKRVPVIHTTIKVLGGAVVLLGFYAADLTLHFSFTNAPTDPFSIAMAHTVINVVTTILLMPCTKLLIRIANFFVRDSSEQSQEDFSFVDSRLLATPSVAIAECGNKTVEMAKIAEDTIFCSLSLLNTYDPKVADKIRENEDSLDLYEDKLGTYLVQLSSKALSDHDSRQISKQLHTIGDFERIGDHAVNLLKTADEIHTKGIKFSEQADKELRVLMDALREILEITTDAFARDDIEAASHVEPLEQVIDTLIADIKSNHIQRLQAGLCTIEIGFVLSDLLTNYERVSDHCSNIAVAIIETHQNTYQAHEYLNGVKNASNAEFQKDFDTFRAKYSLT